MPPAFYNLYWENKLIGRVNNPEPIDFPWMAGNLGDASLDAELHEVMKHTLRQAESEDESFDWPFPERFMESWKLVDDSGEESQICMPIIDIVAGTIEWR